MATREYLKVTRRFAQGRMRKELRACRDVLHRRRLDAVRLVSDGHGVPEVGRLLACSRTTVRQAVLAFNAHGFPGLVDARAENGRERYLSAEQDAQILKALEGRAPDGGLWNGRKLRDFIKTTFGIDAGVRYGWKTLVRLGWSLQRPQSRHAGGDAAEQAEFKKNWRPSSRTSAKRSRTRHSSSGRKTRRASASTRSSAASGRREGTARSRSNDQATSGSTSTAS